MVDGKKSGKKENTIGTGGTGEREIKNEKNLRIYFTSLTIREQNK